MERGSGQMECWGESNHQNKNNIKRKKKPSLASLYPVDAFEGNRRNIADLAHRFLEENVRKCIPKRLPISMERTMAADRVPTPFVFASDIYLRQRRALAMVATSITEAEYNYVDEYLHRTTAIYDTTNINYRRPGPVLSIENQEAGLESGLVLVAGGGGGGVGGGFGMMNSPARNRNRENHGSGGGGGGSNGGGGSHQNYCSDFATTLKKWSAPIPPVLLRKLGRHGSDSPLGKVKVMLKVCDLADEVSGMGILGVDQRKKQVTLLDPAPTGITPEERRVGVSAPKMFAFDGIFAEDDDQAEICAASAAELVASVVGGEDGCFLSLGYCTSGKQQTLFGRPANQKMGVVPTAVSWLFKSIQEQKQKTGSRFSVRVSAVEVTGGSGHEVINDLLLPFVKDEDQPPSALLDSQSGGGGRGGKNSASTAPVLNNVSEVRAPNPETAGFYLDAALNAMSKEDPIRHFIFTLSVYQYTVDKNGKGAVVGGRSRLHCVMLGNGSPSISVLGGLLLAVLNGQRHLPSRDSKLGAILRECLGSLTCRAVVMIHVSNAHSRYAETLAALQLGSRVHRLRRSRRLKGSVGSGNGSGSSGSGEEMRMNNMCSSTGVIVGTATSSLLGEVETGSSDIDPSSSEQSCDTVIYLGPSIDDATDGEHPPVYLPSLDSNGSAENGIVPGKCSLSENGTLGPPPKTKSPKPKSNKVVADATNFSNAVSKSEEKWVDGPKVSKYRQMSSSSNGLNGGVGQGLGGPGGGGSLTKKSETWIDGPAAARVHVHHQASNFPSPKKSVQGHHKRGGGGILATADSSSCSISSAKAQMIQKWISNQSHSFLDDHGPHSSLDDGTCLSSIFGSSCHHGGGGGGGIGESIGIGGSGMVGLQSSLYSNMPAVSPFQSQYHHHHPYSLAMPSISIEPEYKALTVFKTCDDDLDEETIKDECIGNGFEFEFIEVVEPEIPVPTRDACLQVTEEDIALSFLEVDSIENPLPESDQNFTMASESYFSSSSSPGNHHHSYSHSHRGRNTTFSTEGPQQQSNTNTTTTSSIMSEEDEKNEDHPLRVLSQECLTVVSTFTDSMSIAGGDIERFWPRLSYTNDMTMQDIHEMGMCHGLCKNLASLSQMSLTHDTQQHNGHCNGCGQQQHHKENPYGAAATTEENQHHRRFHSMGREKGCTNRSPGTPPPPPQKSQSPMKQEQQQQDERSNHVTSVSSSAASVTSVGATTTSVEATLNHGTNNKVQIKSPPKTMAPPALSDESIFIPKSPINPKTVGGGCSTTTTNATTTTTTTTMTPGIKKTKDQSDAEQDSTISIPPMKLLELLTPISRSNNNNNNNNTSTTNLLVENGVGSCPPPTLHSCSNQNQNPPPSQLKTNQHHQNFQNQSSQQQQIPPHKGCDHNHHHFHHPHNLTNGANLQTISTAPSSMTLTNTTTNTTMSPSLPSPPSIQMFNGNDKRNGLAVLTSNPNSIVVLETPPSSPVPPELVVQVTKSPSKSKSRKIAKFFRSRSKSPKTAGATSSSESSGKSSVSSSDSKLKLSSSSSCSSGASSATSPAGKPPISSSSPKKSVSSPSKKSLLLSLPAKNNGTNKSNSNIDYQYTCDSNSHVPLFAPTPTTIAE